ncbi:MAG TPA: LysE family transporter [Geobacteraceae bacterium]
MTDQLLAFPAAGVVLGLSAGCSPGPLLALVITQTLRHGAWEGVKVALSPLLTDLPIIALCLVVLTRLANMGPVLGVVSLAGGLFVLYLAYETCRASRTLPEAVPDEPQSLGKGVLVNALSPHPYLFWLTVGTPAIIRGWQVTPGAAFLFVASFFGSLVGAKVCVALLAGRSRSFLTGRGYGAVMSLLGLLLAGFAIFLCRDGLARLGVLS